MKEKVIGIIGGLGPEATVDLFQKILEATPARKDQDHLRILIDCNPKIPDRVEAIFGDGETPAPALIAMAQNLERAGADFLVIACNTAHYYIGEIRRRVSVPVLHMIEETAAYCGKKFPRLGRFGLLAGDAAVRLGLYPRAFAQVQKEILIPQPEDQKGVQQCIYEIKAGNLGRPVKERLLQIVASLKGAGAQAVVLGCTEVPLVLKAQDLDLPGIDATRVLAEASVTLARGAGR